jgi:hypothetical protein
MLVAVIFISFLTGFIIHTMDTGEADTNRRDFQAKQPVMVFPEEGLEHPESG